MAPEGQSLSTIARTEDYFALLLYAEQNNPAGQKKRLELLKRVNSSYYLQNVIPDIRCQVSLMTINRQPRLSALQQTEA